MDHRLKLVKFLIEQKEHRESVGTIFKTMLGKLYGSNTVEKDSTRGAHTEHTVRMINAIKSLGVVHAAQKGLDVFVNAFADIVGKNANQRGIDSKSIKLDPDGKLKETPVEIKGPTGSVGKRLSIPEIVKVDQLRGFEPEEETTVRGVPETHAISMNPESLGRRMYDIRTAAHTHGPISPEFKEEQGKAKEVVAKINTDTDIRRGMMGIISKGLGDLILRIRHGKDRHIVYSVPQEVVRTAVEETGTLRTPYFETKPGTATIYAKSTTERLKDQISPETVRNSTLTVHPDEIDILKQYTDEETFNGIHDHLKNSNLVSQ